MGWGGCLDAWECVLVGHGTWGFIWGVHGRKKMEELFSLHMSMKGEKYLRFSFGHLPLSTLNLCAPCEMPETIVRLH